MQPVVWENDIKLDHPLHQNTNLEPVNMGTGFSKSKKTAIIFNSEIVSEWVAYNMQYCNININGL